MQGARDVALGELALDGHTLAFALVDAGAKWTAAFGADGVECTFSQRGISLPCTIESVSAEVFAERAAGGRPQDPEPPFPYEVQEVTYEHPEAGLRLAGTLTLPADGPHPVALLISGSGAQDRDETVAGHRPFLVLADHLSRNGIAVLRVDDRGVGGSTGNADAATMEDFAKDVEAGITFLSSHPQVDGEKIGLIGHSEGGAIAPYVAARNSKVAFVIMLAGPGVTGGDLLIEQVGALLRTMDADEAAIAEAKAAQAEVMKVLATTADDTQARAAIRKIMDPEGVGGEAVDAQLEMVVGPWFRTFVAYDPAPTLKKLRIPILAVNGALDTQVVASQNIPAIEKAVSGNPKAKVVVLDGLNHLFQPATTGSPAEYAQIEQTLDPALLELVTDWLTTSVRQG
jgi:uncharacterized protein